jgi:hypothetical protein
MAKLSEAQIVMTVPRALATGVALIVVAAGALWTVLNLTIGSLSANVSNLQQAMTQYHGELTQAREAGHRAEVNLLNTVAEIRQDVALGTKELLGMGADIQRIAESSDRIEARLADVRDRVIRIESQADDGR